MWVRIPPWARQDVGSAGSTDGKCGTLITCRSRVQFPPGVQHCSHCRISSTGQSACLVNRLSGFESCIRLHYENTWKAVRLVTRPVSKTGPGDNPEGSTPLPSSKQSRLRSSTERAASFYLARCGFKSRRGLAVMPPLCVRHLIRGNVETLFDGRGRRGLRQGAGASSARMSSGSYRRRAPRTRFAHELVVVDAGHAQVGAVGSLAGFLDEPATSG
jgi:hypothetical protein